MTTTTIDPAQDPTRASVGATSIDARRRIDCDALVIGSGASGMTTAFTAAHHGLDVVVAEKATVFGGTTALSGGYLWIPDNAVSRAAGVSDDIDAARTYLRAEAGNFFDGERVDAFLNAGAAMIDFMQAESHVKFGPAVAFSDYHPDQPGGVSGGRSILTLPFDGRELGDAVKALRRPKPEMSVLGLTVSSGPELKHFYNVTRSAKSFAYVAGRLLRHMTDVALHGRGMTLTNGNALVARLYKSCVEKGVRFLLGSPAQRLIVEDGRVVGAVLDAADGPVSVRARRGVVLASGGFPNDRDRRRALYGHSTEGEDHVSAGNPDNTGDGARLGEGVGARFDDNVAQPAAWAPVSIVRRKDGTVGTFPHFICRGKPGVVAVLRRGVRFVNEANSYHDFIQGLLRALEPGEAAEAFLIADHRTIRRYGLGVVKPFPFPLRPHLKSGYLLRGGALDSLAEAAGIAAEPFKAQIARYNADIATGDDPQFGRGSTAYNRFHGDPENQPHPNLAPIQDPPFYAVRIIPGDLGTFAGVRTNAAAEALDADGAPVPGLYAVGADMLSIMGGNYPGGGITLGPGMTFGYIAGRRLAGASD